MSIFICCFDVECFVHNEIFFISDFSISTEKLTELSQSIQQSFPKEEASTYYIPYKYNKVTNSKVLAKGKLWDKYHFYRQKLIVWCCKKNEQKVA